MVITTAGQQFAAVYDCNAYGSSVYNDAQTCASTVSTGSSSSQPAGGFLANTGVNTIAFLVGGSLIIALSIVLWVKKAH